MTDAHTQRRLEREARTMFLGTLVHDELAEGGDYALVRVEVSYSSDPDDADCQGHPAGPFDPMGQTVHCDGTCRPGAWHAGFYLVKVPAWPPTGDDDVDLARHPATLARARVEQTLNERYAESTIDDTCAA